MHVSQFSVNQDKFMFESTKQKAYFFFDFVCVSGAGGLQQTFFAVNEQGVTLQKTSTIRKTTLAS